MKTLPGLTIILLLNLFCTAQAQLLTTAEKTDYTSTSTYADVMAYTDSLMARYDHIRMDTMAVTTEGRIVPLFVLADPMPQSPEDLKNDDRIVVYYQANIHAGEVEGKEATQMLMRDLLEKGDSIFFSNVVLLVCPIFNADGNEKISKENRTNQNGPVNGVGVRYNGQNLDLNRDGMKLETPEVQGLVTQVLNRWDPTLSVDCHTTNGSYHEEPVTFVWMMNPNGDRDLINYMRDDFSPAVHWILWDKYGVENIFYGEFIDRMDYDKGWISYASEPRYLVNYIGVRNRFAILNENYVYADFKTRVNGSYYLLQSMLDYVIAHKDEMKKAVADADSAMFEKFYGPGVADSFAIEYKGVPTPEKITIKAIEADTIPGVQGYWRYKQSDRKRTVTVDCIADYIPTKSVAMPFCYLLTVKDKEVIKNLRMHGIEIEMLEDDGEFEVEQFNISSMKPSGRLNQGHYTNQMEGSFEKVKKQFPKGTLVIRTAQELGNLVSYLLEPQADDGLLKWNYFDKYLAPQWGGGFYPYPVYKLIEYTNLKTIPCNQDYK
ncbi:MAG TPA: M14 family metallopeptidase [Bacteroidales bacterium]|nr:M14 family metallopeptidase [Bacteroidales bacterium]HRX97121.1 M14 family metallopeptidase [Bacteroidales bacterium]